MLYFWWKHSTDCKYKPCPTGHALSLALHLWVSSLRYHSVFNWQVEHTWESHLRSRNRLWTRLSWTTSLCEVFDQSQPALCGSVNWRGAISLRSSNDSEWLPLQIKPNAFRLLDNWSYRNSMEQILIELRRLAIFICYRDKPQKYAAGRWQNHQIGKQSNRLKGPCFELRRKAKKLWWCAYDAVQYLQMHSFQSSSYGCPSQCSLMTDFQGMPIYPESLFLRFLRLHQLGRLRLG